MGLLDKLFDPGKGSRDRAGQLGDQSIIKGFNFSGPGGVGGNFTFKNGRAHGGASLGGFQDVYNQLIAGGAGRMGPGGGYDMSGINQLAGDTVSSLQTPGQFNQISGQGDYNTLGGIMNQAAGITQKDPFELGATISDKLRALSERKNQRLANRFFDRMKSTGNLTSSAGMQQAYEMQAQQDELGLQQDLAGLQFGQGMIRDAFGRVMGAGQAREGIAGRTFGESMGMNQFNRAGMLDAYNVGANNFGLGMQADAQNQGLGLAQLQAATGLQQLPMQQMMQFMQMAGISSGSMQNAAAIHQGNASMAKSPWLEALNAVGQFAGNIGVNVGGE